MPRLFTALEIAPEIRYSLSLLRGGLPGARWIDSENYHITLRFIGDVAEPEADDIAAELRRVRRPDFNISLCGVGSFGSRKPHSIWAGVEAVSALHELQADQERRMQRLGLEPDRRKFLPHVTLARVRDCKQRDLADYLAVRGDFQTAPFPAGRFVLLSSRASRGGGPYVMEEAYPLAA